jgi:hypothetical protein
MSDAPSESEAQCRSAQGKSSTSSPATAPEMLASEVTPGLLAGAEPDTHQFYVTIFYKGVIKWDRDSRRYHSNSGTGSGMYGRKGGLDLTSASGLIKR